MTDSLLEMYNSYKEDKHLNFYPNAMGNLDSTINLLNSAISNILKPGLTALNRFGYKEISAKNIGTLNYLKEIFQESIFVFCFRDPMKQWPSVRSLDWWPYSKSIDAFLDEYYRVSNIYLEYASNNCVKAFVENNDLREHAKVKKIMSYLNVDKIDTELINVTVSSAKPYIMSATEEKTILTSKAYVNYLNMKTISRSFY